MLANAAWSGHRDICILACKWGATDWNWMLAWARNNLHDDLCILAREWGATTVDFGIRETSDGCFSSQGYTIIGRVICNFSEAPRNQV